MSESSTQLSSRGINPPYKRIAVEKVGESIGAVIYGPPIGANLDLAVVDEIKSALLANRVVFLRDQNHASDEDQRAFASLLGTVTKPHPTVKGDGAAILPIDSENGRANSWHTDVTFIDRIPSVSILRAITLPPYGGTTIWGNTVAAYENLHPGLQQLASSLRAVHSNLYDYALARPKTGGIDVKQEEYRKEFATTEFETEHPVVRIHPETGEPSLLLGHFVQSFVGVSTFDFHDLYALFQRHISAPENTVRWSWRDGDIAIWDNRSTQHYAVADYGEATRRLHRITLAGDVPVGINGDVSRVIKGDASEFSPLAA